MPEAGAAGRPLRADARRNRETIIAAAESLFLRDGANASLEEIARRAGVGSATLHRHFPSRTGQAGDAAARLTPVNRITLAASGITECCCSTRPPL